MKSGKYMIYKMVNTKGEEEVLFFLPEVDEDKLKRKLARLLEVQSYKNNGWSVFGVLYVDKETYLNARIDYKVKEYCHLDISEQETRQKRNTMIPEVYYQTMQMIQDSKWCCLKCIAMNIRRCIREDFDVFNEIGIQLYDQYLQALA